MEGDFKRVFKIGYNFNVCKTMLIKVDNNQLIQFWPTRILIFINVSSYKFENKVKTLFFIGHLASWIN